MGCDRIQIGVKPLGIDPITTTRECWIARYGQGQINEARHVTDGGSSVIPEIRMSLAKIADHADQVNFTRLRLRRR